MRKLGDNRFDPWRVPHPMGEIPADMRDYAGAFIIPIQECAFQPLKVIASRANELWGKDEPGFLWDHVSVSTPHRCPRWEEMCFVKEKFFYANEVAMQLHPVADYINNHPYCLHLWRPIAADIPLPPSILVGIKEFNLEER